MLVAWVAFCAAWRDLRVGNTGTYYAALSRIKDTCTRFRFLRSVPQALTTKAIAECVGSGGVGEAEANIELLRLVSAAAVADWDAKLTVFGYGSRLAEAQAQPHAGSSAHSCGR